MTEWRAERDPFTEGKWAVFVYAAPGQKLMLVGNLSESRAKLIAAAPDMLAGAQGAVACWYGQQGRSCRDLPNEMEILRRALP